MTPRHQQASIGLVLARLSKWLVVLALTLSLGAHWMLLQSIAWAGMIASYSCDTSFTEAVSKTFDGQHPCALCKLVKQGKAAEKKEGAQKPDIKVDKMPSVAGSFIFTPPVFSFAAPRPSGPLATRLEAPPKPPPRLA